MKIISSDLNGYLGKSIKGLKSSMGVNTIVRSKKKKNSRYAITNVSMKDLSKIIKEFEKLPYEGFVWKRFKHEPTGSYFYLSIQIANFMLRDDAFNSHVGPVRTKIISTQQIPIS